MEGVPDPSGSGQEQGSCEGRENSLAGARRGPRGGANPTPTLVAPRRVGSPPRSLPRTLSTPSSGSSQGSGSGVYFHRWVCSRASLLSPPSLRSLFITLIHTLTLNALISPLVCSLRRSPLLIPRLICSDVLFRGSHRVTTGSQREMWLLFTVHGLRVGLCPRGSVVP